jgi:hypothetical protein
MFDKLRYAVGVNKCIAEIGVRRGRIPTASKKDVRDVGYTHKNTHEECATALLFAIDAGQRPDNYDIVLSDWVDRGLVRQDVFEAIVHET